MGSSHMEAKQVPMSLSTAGRLGTLLPDETVYNIGISGHDFLVCYGNLENAVDYYKPTDYLIIETSALSFTEAQEENALNGKKSPYEPHEGIVGTLQQNHFFRWAYTQLEKFGNRLDWPFDNKMQPIIEVQKENDDVGNGTADAQAPKRLLENIARTVSEKTDVTVIIVYHPATAISQDGTLHLTQEAAKDAFKQACEDNGIIFLDMSERFLEEYETNHVLPHGFANSSVGSGHLNRNGHAMIADELYQIIEEGA